jgi:hypothetical protein
VLPYEPQYTGIESVRSAARKQKRGCGGGSVKWLRNPLRSRPRLMSRSLLNIAKRSLLRLMLSCVGLASKHAAGWVSGLMRFQCGT